MSKKTHEGGSDPRIVRSKRAAIEAAGRAFLRDGYAAATMDDVAKAAGLTKRTLYNNFESKDALFLAAIDDMMDFAAGFSRDLDDAFFDGVARDPAPALYALGRRFALAVVRPQVVALRRLLISEGSRFPGLAAQYFERAPGSVLAALARGFQQIEGHSSLRIDDPRTAAEHFAYLVVGAQLDRAILVAEVPKEDVVAAAAEAGVRVFLAAYG